MQPLPRLEKEQGLSLLPELSPVQEPTRTKIGLDAEALYWGRDGSLPWNQVALCFCFGVEGDVHEIRACWGRPGRFRSVDLLWLRTLVSIPGTVVVGHNALQYDLPLLNGTLLYNGLSPLPDTGVMTIDTVNTVRYGRAYSNTLRALTRRFGLAEKESKPDWRRILEWDPVEWDRMMSYCSVDVVCALQLERKLKEAGIPAPMRVWSPRRDDPIRHE